MKIVRTIAELPEAVEPSPVGLVPTMGAFHEGHLSLFAAARDENDAVVASLFVNPAQFGAGEDLDRYPRDEERDAKLAEQAGVDFLFAPSAEEMYPEGFETWVDVGELGRPARGRVPPRPLPRRRDGLPASSSTSSGPTRAYFGQKDAQQAAVVKQLVPDLNLDARDPRPADDPRRGRARALVAQRLPLARGARSGARPAARARDEGP